MGAEPLAPLPLAGGAGGGVEPRRVRVAMNRRAAPQGRASSSSAAIGQQERPPEPMRGKPRRTGSEAEQPQAGHPLCPALEGPDKRLAEGRGRRSAPPSSYPRTRLTRPRPWT